MAHLSTRRALSGSRTFLSAGRECFRTAITKYGENFEAIVNEILSLVGEREVMLRVMSITHYSRS
jgi:hypothetical protein